MIYGKPTPARSIMDLMAETTFLFYPTGSRFFGNAKEDSDHDFFVGEENGLVDWLLKQGFYLFSDSNYADSDTLRVYRYVSYFTFEGTICDVQVVRDPLRKWDIQTKMKEAGFFPGNGVEKHNVVAFWDLCYALVGGTNRGIVAPLETKPVEKPALPYSNTGGSFLSPTRTLGFMATTLPSSSVIEIEALLRNGKRINAIKLLREITHHGVMLNGVTQRLGLGDAKDIIYAYDGMRGKWITQTL